MSAAERDAALCARRIHAEAAVWVTWQHEPSWTPAREAGLKRWLAEKPAHRAAFALAAETWNERERRVSWPVLKSAIACLIILVVAGVLGYVRYRPVTTLPTEIVAATQIGERHTVSLADGSIVKLNTNSRVVVRYDSRLRQVILQSGEAYFQVAKRGPKEQRPFTVVVGDRKVIALGTSFLVRRDESADIPLTVTLLEGRVAVAPVGWANVLPPKSTANITVLDRQGREIFRRAGSRSFGPLDLDPEKNWTNGHLTFDGTSLPKAIAEVNRYSQVQIELGLSDQAAANIHVRGTFVTGQSSAFATLVAHSNNLQVVTRDNRLVLEPMN